MTEKDLWAYINARNRHRLACAKLFEFTSEAYYCPSPRYTGMPREINDYSPDRISAVIERKDKLSDDCYRAAGQMAEAARYLELAEAELNDEERLFLHYRYRMGMTWDEVNRKMHQSKSRTKRMRDSILKKIEKIEKSKPKETESTCSDVL